jgi:hypothetical protein
MFIEFSTFDGLFFGKSLAVYRPYSVRGASHTNRIFIGLGPSSYLWQEIRPSLAIFGSNKRATLLTVAKTLVKKIAEEEENIAASESGRNNCSPKNGDDYDEQWSYE